MATIFLRQSLQISRKNTKNCFESPNWICRWLLTMANGIYSKLRLKSLARSLIGSSMEVVWRRAQKQFDGFGSKSSFGTCLLICYSFIHSVWFPREREIHSATHSLNSSILQNGVKLSPKKRAALAALAQRNTLTL